MLETFDCVVAGHICLDIIPALSRTQFLPSPGRVLQVGPALLATGGLVSNTGLAVHKLGLKTRLMGKVGSDCFGQAILHLVNAFDQTLTKGMIETRKDGTSYSIILSPPGTDRVILHYAGCNDTFVADDIDYEMLANARLFHFGYPPLMKKLIEHDGAELTQIFRRAKAAGVTTSLDMCLPDPTAFSGSVDWTSILTATLPYVDIFMPSLEEIAFMLRREVFDFLSSASGDPLSLVTTSHVTSLGQGLLSMGPKIVGLKIGYLGLYLRTAEVAVLSTIGRGGPKDLTCWGQRELWSSCFETEVVGTTGAGDATVAGFLAAMLRGFPIDEAATVACAVGACSVEAADALGGIPTWDETLARIAKGWGRKSLPLRLEEWVQHNPRGVWYGPKDSSLSGQRQ